MQARLLTVVTVMLVFVAAPAMAQSAASPGVVVSVRSNRSDTNQVNVRLEGSRFAANNVSLPTLIQIAFGGRAPLPENRIAIPERWTGNGAYVRAARYDVVLKAEQDLSPDDLPGLLQQVLADRFRLVAHHEQREVPTFTLTLRDAAKGPGPGLVRRDIDCATLPPPPPRTGGDPLSPGECSIGSVPGRAVAHAITLDRLARMISTWTDDRREVENRTGLTGYFDVDLVWRPDRVAQDATASETAPPLVTAVQEQLGLRLQPGAKLVDVVVIDRVEQPSEN